MSQSAPPRSRGRQAPEDGAAPWSHVWGNPRPLAIGSASHYAQEHNLAVDFYMESSERAASHLIALSADCQHVERQQLTSSSHLTQCTIPAPTVDDYWMDTQSSTAYWQQLLSSLDGLCLRSMYALEPRYQAATRSRCELPILRSDNNLDLLGLAHVIYSRRASALAEASIPPIEIDASGDDGLHFPCWSDQLMKHFDSYIPKEAIQDPNDSRVLEYVVLYSTADISDPDQEAISGLIEMEFMVYKQGRV